MALKAMQIWSKETGGAGMIRKLVGINSAGVIVLAAFFFIYPSVRAVLDIRDRMPFIAALTSDPERNS